MALKSRRFDYPLKYTASDHDEYNNWNVYLQILAYRDIDIMNYLIPRPVIFLIIFTEKLDLIIWAQANWEVRDLVAGCPKLQEHVNLPQDQKRIYTLMYSEYLVRFRGTVDLTGYYSGKSTLELEVDGINDDEIEDVDDEYYDDYNPMFRWRWPPSRSKWRWPPPRSRK